MRKGLFYIVILLTATKVNCVQAQDVAAIRFADFLEQLPKPLATYKETIEAYGTFDQMDKVMGAASKEMDGSLTVLYTPLLELFKKRLDDKSQLAGLSKEERDMVEAFRHGSIGFDENNIISALRYVMDQNRPLISSGKLSWTKVSPSAPATVQKLYQQIKEVEGQFDWVAFTKQAENYRPKFGPSDGRLSEISDKFSEDLKKLPKKRIEIMDGIYDDVEDPEKAIALLEKYKTDWQQAFERMYTTRYQWWSLQYAKLSAMSKRIDAIAAQTNATEGTIQPVLADLQARTWEAWQRLYLVTQGIFIDATLAASADIQVEGSLAIYRKYKENSK
ncbi:hypothetical protein [Flavisolibacter tropicus]|uniref:DUF3829 domain-containing protein n=1 Tax=Flavisolibacter tropicus TaxID=1492898 RepID=A0A172TZ56_9BACT|nr:hypothetical protein [Flavisolibacter tropicus]ANE52381.1 hypothetical protein SY85_19735 [Flavisolibacter tropicus]